jgi:CheY-like chemotaxis protein
MLTDLGYSVIQASSGAIALAILRGCETDIDILVTDYLMPGMSGGDLAREAHGLKPNLPALLVTGYANFAHGPGSELPRLTKPFRQAELAARVADLLEGCRQTDNVVQLAEKKRARE